MNAWEALQLTRTASDRKIAEVMEMIKAAAMSEPPQTWIIVPDSHRSAYGLTSYLQDRGYSVSRGDQRDSGYYVSWTNAKDPKTGLPSDEQG